MNPDLLHDIVEAVLYEGYVLYPYRASSKKNRRERFTFGRVHPRAYNLAQNGLEPCLMQTECLVKATTESPILNVTIGFLHPMSREIAALKQPTDRGHGQSPSRSSHAPPTTPENFSDLPHYTSLERGLQAASTSPNPSFPNNTKLKGLAPDGINSSPAAAFTIVPELRVGDQLFQTWHEAIEQKICVPTRALDANSPVRATIPFRFPGARDSEPILDHQKCAVGMIFRRRETIEGVVELSIQRLELQLHKITVRIINHTPLLDRELNDPESVLLRTMASTHTVLTLEGAEFISLMDPPAEFQAAASDCENIGAWPVLAGDESRHERETMLSSPIILYDYPKIAPESAGPMFDGTEIDEILTLRLQTLTDDEKLEMRGVDAHARRLLERTEALLPDSLMKMHGLMRPPSSSPPDRGYGQSPGRSSHTPPAMPENSPTPAQIDFDDFFGAGNPLKGVSVGGVFLQAGDRVRLRPKARADVVDIALAGKTAVIEAVEQDLEKRIHFAVVVEDDPGKDLGLERQPGHRFFYGIDEIEPLKEAVA